MNSDLVSYKIGGVEPDTKLTIIEMSAPADKASMNALVPDLAMVPRLLIMSALVIPIPESMRVRVLASTSGNLDVKLLLPIKFAGVCQGLIPDLVQRIGGV